MNVPTKARTFKSLKLTYWVTRFQSSVDCYNSKGGCVLRKTFNTVSQAKAFMNDPSI